MLIAHVTTVHPRDDSRIRFKMVASLSARYVGDVVMLVQDGRGHEADERGFDIIDTGPSLPRMKRILLGGWRMARALKRVNPRIIHFHDPELIPLMLALKIFGYRIIYDIHEDYVGAVSQNFRLSRFSRWLLPYIVGVVEQLSSRVFDHLVAATPHLASRFSDCNVSVVRNLPILKEFTPDDYPPMNERACTFTYIGTITENRNIFGMLDAAGALAERGIAFTLAGEFTVSSDERLARAHAAWNAINFEGWVTREDVSRILGETRVGLVIIKPIEHEMVGLPIKLFEYMSAGLPVIASNFPLWQEMIRGFGCGLTVNPEDPEEIAEAISYLISHPNQAAEMGWAGRKAIERELNWGVESSVLFSVYERLLFSL